MKAARIVLTRERLVACAPDLLTDFRAAFQAIVDLTGDGDSEGMRWRNWRDELRNMDGWEVRAPEHLVETFKNAGMAIARDGHRDAH